MSTKDTASTGPAPTFQEVCTTRGGPPLPVPRHRRGAPPRPRAPPPKCHVIAGRAPAPLGVAPLQHTMVPCHFADCFLEQDAFLARLEREFRRFRLCDDGGLHVSLMTHLKDALLDQSIGVDARKSRAALLCAILLGTHPCPGLRQGNNNPTTTFYGRKSAEKPVYDEINFEQVYNASVQALGIVQGKKGVGRPGKQHFLDICHLPPTVLEDYGVSHICGDTFLASLDPTGVLPLANACVVVDFSAAAVCIFAVHTYDTAPKEYRFTKTLPVKWIQPYRKLMRTQDADGAFGFTTDTGRFVPLRSTFQESPVYKEHLAHLRTRVGWSNGAEDPLDFAIGLVCMGSLATFELAPRYKAAYSVCGDVGAGKSSFIDAGMGRPLLGELCIPAAQRSTDKGRSTVNWYVRSLLTTSKVLILDEQSGFNVEALREALGNRPVCVKDTAGDSVGRNANVRATIVLEANANEAIKLGDVGSGLAAKVFHVELAPRDTSPASPRLGPQDFQKLLAANADEMFWLQVLVHADPFAAQAIEIWRKKGALPGMTWRPVLLAEQHVATRQESARSGASNKESSSAAVDQAVAAIEASFERDEKLLDLQEILDDVGHGDVDRGAVKRKLHTVFDFKLDECVTKRLKVGRANVRDFYVPLRRKIDADSVDKAAVPSA